MVTCQRFLSELRSADLFDQTEQVDVTLYASLGATGKATLRTLRWCRAWRETNYRRLPATRSSQRRSGCEKKIMLLGGSKRIAFDWDKYIIWMGEQIVPKHPNGIKFSARSGSGKEIFKGLYCSIGGGFVVGENEPVQRKEAIGKLTGGICHRQRSYRQVHEKKICRDAPSNS